MRYGESTDKPEEIVYGKAVEQKLYGDNQAINDFVTKKRVTEDTFDTFTFSWALEYLKEGDKVRREHWDDEYLMMDMQEIVVMNTRLDAGVPWEVSQRNVLATDWMIFEGENDE
jgi:hypothetical protein|tara:strand:+ start:1657 stop:1998 length:342 start_codon:yes stop_codon:yes gene_type:complete